MKNEVCRRMIYAHGCGDTFYGMADEIGLKGEAADMFGHALYEVEFDVTIYDDGTYFIHSVKDGRQTLTAEDDVEPQ